MQNIFHTVKRYRTLSSHRIRVLPIAILMPHSACNCRCVMCDIWKGNKNSKQLTEESVREILDSLKKLETKRVLMSGGEALLNKNFFRFCELIKERGIKITLLSTGLTLEHHAEKIIQLVDEVIVSLDGDESKHDEIRNIKGAYENLKKGVQKIKSLKADFPVSGRSVIHKLNFRNWDKIILSAKDIGLNSISFLPADVSSEAFNRKELWDAERQESVLVAKEELQEFKKTLENLITDFSQEFSNKFILESPEKLRKIYQYYAAHHDLENFPKKKCNAPWVSAVIEADGKVRPCFFMEEIGSIHEDSFSTILNTEKNIAFRKNLNTQNNPTCEKCVCYLNLPPRSSYF